MDDLIKRFGWTSDVWADAREADTAASWRDAGKIIHGALLYEIAISDGMDVTWDLLTLREVALQHQCDAAYAQFAGPSDVA